ncbi:HAD family hydrolase [Halopenitus persicus]|uniref:HAD family hydrolase n=1 Tax=Halopenitus persicus TaxID=1048396 RepID=UPI000BBB4000|nr:HAD family phosphatase [Halopenitus persicus]
MNTLLFDMDGIVVDSVGYWNEIRAEIITEKLSVNDVSISELVGMNAEDEYEYLAKNHELPLPKAAYVSLIDEYAETVYREYVTIFPKFETILRDATENGISVGLVSASPRRRVEMVLDRFGFETYLDIVVAGDDLSGPSKPDPTIYEHTASRLGVPTDACVTVEDSEHGVTAAKEAGMYCLGYACHSGQPLERANETFEKRDVLRARLRELCNSGDV